MHDVTSKGGLRPVFPSPVLRGLTLGLALFGVAMLHPPSPLLAQEAGGAEETSEDAGAPAGEETSGSAAAPGDSQGESGSEGAGRSSSGEGAATRKREKECKPGFGCVTNLPLPRFVSLKGGEGNARRGPGLTHRIDWVFTRPGMPLKITAEYENWRRVEDQDGAGGWVHYALLSGVRSVVVTLDMAEMRDGPYPNARVLAQAEMGVVARLLQCNLDWCRISVDGERGWLPKTAIWGVLPDEVIE